MKPLEALEAAINWLFLSSFRRFENKPGAVIEKLPKSIKTSLADLKSEDINETSKRKEYWSIYSTTENSDKEAEYKRILTDFDEKILK